MKITLVGDIFPADEFLSVGFGIRSQFEATKGERWKDNICLLYTSDAADEL